MAVNESLDALDAVTAANNTPAGTASVGTDMDDHLRDIKKNIRDAADHQVKELAPTGFEGQLHADKSRSASGIITMRFHDGAAFRDIFEFSTATAASTASAKIRVLNLHDSAIPAVAVRGSEFSASQIPVAATTILGAANTFTDDQTLENTDAGASQAPAFALYRNSASPAVDDLLGVLKFDGKDDGGTRLTYASLTTKILDPVNTSEDAELRLRTVVASTQADRVRIAQGLYTPNATGGDKGADSINASAVYDDNVLLTPYVLEAAKTGQINMAALDNGVPNLEIEEQVEQQVPTKTVMVERGFIEELAGRRVVRRKMVAEERPKTEKVPVLDADGNEIGEQEVPLPVETVTVPARTEERIHGPARRFANNLAELDPSNYAQKWKSSGHLPALPSKAEWAQAKGKISMGTLIQRLMETAEVQAVHIDKLEARLRALEP